jgi:hypothetical protein
MAEEKTLLQKRNAPEITVTAVESDIEELKP